MLDWIIPTYVFANVCFSSSVKFNIELMSIPDVNFFILLISESSDVWFSVLFDTNCCIPSNLIPYKFSSFRYLNPTNLSSLFSIDISL